MEENINNSEIQDTETETVTMTKAELEELKQRVGDQRVSQAQKTWEKNSQEKIQAALKKQKDLQQLDDLSRLKAEYEEKLNEQQKEIASMKLEKNRSELKSVLGSRGLSAEFADILNITDDIEASQAVIEKLDKLFREAVKKEVKDKLLSVSGTPKGDGASSGVADTKEKFLALPASEMQRLLDERPEFYSKFLN